MLNYTIRQQCTFVWAACSIVRLVSSLPNVSECLGGHKRRFDRKLGQMHLHVTCILVPCILYGRELLIHEFIQN